MHRVICPNVQNSPTARLTIGITYSRLPPGQGRQTLHETQPSRPPGHPPSVQLQRRHGFGTSLPDVTRARRPLGRPFKPVHVQARHRELQLRYRCAYPARPAGVPARDDFPRSGVWSVTWTLPTHPLHASDPRQVARRHTPYPTPPKYHPARLWHGTSHGDWPICFSHGPHAPPSRSWWTRAGNFARTSLRCMCTRWPPPLQHGGHKDTCLHSRGHRR